MSRAGQRWQQARRIMTGEAGPGLAWALAAVSMLSVLIAIAAPRELSAVQDHALRRALAPLRALEMSVTAQASWQVTRGGSGVLLPDGAQQLSSVLAGEVRPVAVTAAGEWASVFTTALTIQNPTPKAVINNPPTMEVVYRSQLAAHARLVSGKLPGAVRELAPRPGARHGILLVDAAVTPLTATPARAASRLAGQDELLPARKLEGVDTGDRHRGAPPAAVAVLADRPDRGGADHPAADHRPERLAAVLAERGPGRAGRDGPGSGRLRRQHHPRPVVHPAGPRRDQLRRRCRACWPTCAGWSPAMAGPP